MPGKSLAQRKESKGLGSLTDKESKKGKGLGRLTDKESRKFKKGRRFLAQRMS